MEHAMKKGKLTTGEMLKELPIGICQLRVYLKDGRLPAEKIRNKFFVERIVFENFKTEYGFSV